MYTRSHYSKIMGRLSEPRRFIQVLAGPRQVGKSTLISQVINKLTIPHTLVVADDIPVSNTHWIEETWESVRNKMIYRQEPEHLLVIDEIQKIVNWSEVVKKEWDRDTRDGRNIKVVLLGSSRLLLMKGLTESLAGRFELIKMGHWDYTEMRDAFGFTLDQYVYFGGYPGSASMIDDEDRWVGYVKDSLVIAAITKDVLMTSTVYKPALLRQLFELGCSYSGALLSLNKMLGQLQDAGNVTTLAGYLGLLDESNLLKGIQKYARDASRKYASIPKYQVYNNALRSIYSGRSFEASRTEPSIWGRCIESAIGAYLVNHAEQKGIKVFYWRSNADEVDFVIERYGEVIAIEVKSGISSYNKGLSVFRELFHPQKCLIVGTNGISIEEFLQTDLNLLFR